MTRIVKIRINDQTKVLYTSFDGLEINKVLAIEEYKQIETPRSKEELKIKIAELSEQLRGLDAQLNSDNQNQPQ
jgi:hypothetical protein